MKYVDSQRKYGKRGSICDLGVGKYNSHTGPESTYHKIKSNTLDLTLKLYSSKNSHKYSRYILKEIPKIHRPRK